MPTPIFVLIVATLIVATLALCGVVWVFLRMRQMDYRLGVFFQGKEAKSLEETLRSNAEMVQQHNRDIGELFRAAEYLQRAIQSSVRKVAFERYNPFPGIGGNQSFTLVLLDAHNAGIIVTSLHGREGTRVYAKSVRDGRALQNLSEEEDRVLKNAIMMKGA